MGPACSSGWRWCWDFCGFGPRSVKSFMRCAPGRRAPANLLPKTGRKPQGQQDLFYRRSTYSWTPQRLCGPAWASVRQTLASAVPSLRGAKCYDIATIPRTHRALTSQHCYGTDESREHAAQRTAAVQPLTVAICTASSRDALASTRRIARITAHNRKSTRCGAERTPRQRRGGGVAVSPPVQAEKKTSTSHPSVCALALGSVHWRGPPSSEHH